MKKKAPLRWDKIVGFITVIVMFVFVAMIYIDLQKFGKPNTTISSNNNTISNNKENERQELLNAGQNSAEQNTMGQNSTGQNATVSVQGTAAQSMAQQTKPAGINAVSGKPVVCIDAGHGGNDIGVSANGNVEKTQTLAVAKKVKQYLENSGVTVVMTRTEDLNVSNEERIKICNSSGAAALVSIHRNSVEAGITANGVEAWIHSNKNKKATSLANYILDEVENATGTNNRGVKSGTMKVSSENYYINSHSKCTSLMLELGFATSAKDNAMVTTNIDKTAKAISDGIIKFLREYGY